MDISDPEACWTAFAARDRAADGRFVAGVVSTGIYCRASCPARRPWRREGVRFFANGAAARAAGFRACLRCRPDEARRDAAAVVQAAAMLDTGRVPLDRLAAAAGYAPHHFHRLFVRETGVTPAAYARARRAARAEAMLAEAMLEEGGGVTDTIYAAGHEGPSSFYRDAARGGMTPGVRAKGGAGEAIRWTVADTSLGPLMIAATDRGVCRVAFEEDAAALAGRFPGATIAPGGDDLAALAARVVAAVEAPGRGHDLPLDLRGTAFQAAIWAALAAIPAGETLSYAALAAAAGRPGATRAAGSACGANPVAVLIPCHRARRGDGSAGGYAWGLDRKAALLARERDPD